MSLYHSIIDPKRKEQKKSCISIHREDWQQSKHSNVWGFKDRSI